jgi:hypothetical protein
MELFDVFAFLALQYVSVFSIFMIAALFDRPRRRLFVAISFFCLIMLLYGGAVFLTFATHNSDLHFSELVAFVFTSIGGLAVFLLGYASVVVVGGRSSLRLAEFISRLNGSKHIVEVKEETQVNRPGLIRDASLLYIPALVFMISLALALNIHYLHTTTDVTLPSFLSSIFHDGLSAFDIFLKPPTIGSLRYSFEIIPIMVLIVAVAGVVPSIVLPYFRKFKVTSVNGAPFQRDLLLNTVGIVLGLSAVLSLVNVLYGVWMGSQPHYYSYVLPTMLGFSLHYSLGAFVGREKAEEMIKKILKTGSGERVIQGKVSIQGISGNSV